MGKLNIECSDPDGLLVQVSRAVLSVQAIDDARKSFENAIREAGDNKIGAANQKLLDALVDVGGAGLESVTSALIVDLDTNLMGAAFDSYYALNGQPHAQDRTIRD